MSFVSTTIAGPKSDAFSIALEKNRMEWAQFRCSKLVDYHSMIAASNFVLASSDRSAFGAFCAAKRDLAEQNENVVVGEVVCVVVVVVCVVNRLLL